MKIKIIDLLNKIANGEKVPKKIKFGGELCSFDVEDKDYHCEKYGNIVWYLVDTSNNMNEVLDAELEIIGEPKKIEKINRNRYPGTDIDPLDDILDKLDELIDAVNELKRDK